MPIAEAKLLSMLDSKQPVELRRAAARVLGELGSKTSSIGTALLTSLSDEDQEVRLRCIEAIGKLRVEQALPALLNRLEQGGEEAEQSAHAAAQLGAKGQRSMHNMMTKVAPGLRRYIAAALAAVGAGVGHGGSKADAIAMLLDSDPGVVEATVRSISGEIPALNVAKRETLAKQLADLPKRQKGRLPEATEWAITRLLGALASDRSGAFFWERITPAYPPQIRAAALAALRQWLKGVSKEQLSQLFTCAAETDVRIAAPALLLLQTLPTDVRAAAQWTKLLEAPDPGARQLALEKLGNRTDNGVLNGLVGQLRHPDRAFRDAVIMRLSHTAGGRMALGEALLEAGSPDDAWHLARAQSSFAKEHKLKFRTQLFSQAGHYLETSDRRADALLFLLRAINAEETNRRLEARATAYRKKKAYAKALPYLRSLTRDPACGLPLRLELAACEVKVSDHQLTADAWSTDPALQHFAQLWQRYESELSNGLTAIKWLDSDDLYYLGFHFAEKDSSLRKMASQLLKLAVVRSPRSKTAQAARSKLSREGLE